MNFKLFIYCLNWILLFVQYSLCWQPNAPYKTLLGTDLFTKHKKQNIQCSLNKIMLYFLLQLLNISTFSQLEKKVNLVSILNVGTFISLVQKFQINFSKTQQKTKLTSNFFRHNGLRWSYAHFQSVTNNKNNENIPL